MTVTDIEERTFLFSDKVLGQMRRVPRNIEFDVLRKQLVRSATSIGANIVEAQQAGTKKEFLQYNNIALRSSRESQYWLRLAIHSKMLPTAAGEQLLGENQQLSRIIAAILLKGRGLR